MKPLFFLNKENTGSTQPVLSSNVWCFRSLLPLWTRTQKTAFTMSQDFLSLAPLCGHVYKNAFIVGCGRSYANFPKSNTTRCHSDWRWECTVGHFVHWYAVTTSAKDLRFPWTIKKDLFHKLLTGTAQIRTVSKPMRTLDDVIALLERLLCNAMIYFKLFRLRWNLVRLCDIRCHE